MIGSFDPDNDANALELRLQFKNRVDAPIRYLIEKYEVLVDGAIVRQDKSSPWILGAKEPGTYFPQRGFSRAQYNLIKQRATGSLECSVIYGHPNGSYFRRAKFDFQLDFIKKENGITVNWVARGEPFDVRISD